MLGFGVGFGKKSSGPWGVLLDELFAALTDENNNQIWE